MTLDLRRLRLRGPSNMAREAANAGEPMLTSRAILWAMLFPAVIAVLAIVAGHVGLRRDRRTQPWGPALAVAGAFAAAYFGIVGQLPPWPANSAQGWLFYLVALPVVIGVIAMTVRSRWWVDAALSVILLAATGWLLTRPRVAALEPSEFRATLAVAVGVMIAWWAGMEPLARRQQGWMLPLLLSAAVGCGAVALVAAHTQALGQILGGVAIALVLTAVTGLWFREMSVARGGILAVTLTYLGLLLCGHLYADMTPRDALILAAAPLTLWVGEIPGLRRRTWAKFIVCAIVLLGVLSIAMLPALKELKATMDEQKSYEY
jgi:hypothetical protein